MATFDYPNYHNPVPWKNPYPIWRPKKRREAREAKKAYDILNPRPVRTGWENSDPGGGSR